MKHLVIFFLTYFICGSINAQENIYDFVQLGDSDVGIMDTVILDSKYEYEAFEYKGKKPYFIKIWHPIKKEEEKNYLKVKDLFKFTHHENLKNIQESLYLEYKKNFIRDYLTENLISSDENNYGKHSAENVFELIGEQYTRCRNAKLDGKSDLPIIIYYNGSQGHPFENFVLGEYFASRGYIFVAASFELQFENAPFGMLPYERYITKEYEKSLKTVVQFTRTITNSPNIFFIGHSLGAQMGLRTFGEDSLIKGMVSLETTIEFKTDYEKIKEMWPEVYKKIMVDKANYNFPILFCAATGDTAPFSFLENVKSSAVTYISTIKEFEHNAYLSLFYLRAFLDSSVQQSDKEIIKQRLPLYVKHLAIIYNFIDGIAKNKEESAVESKLIKD